MNGLNSDIANVVQLLHYVEWEDMVHMAIKVNRHLKGKGVAKYSSSSNPPLELKWGSNIEFVSKSKAEHLGERREG